VTGDAGGNTMELGQDPSNPLRIVVSDGIGAPQSFDKSLFSGVQFSGLGGADLIRIRSNGNAGDDLQWLTFPGSVDGGGQAGDQLVIDDSTDATGRTATVTTSTIGDAAGDTLFGPCGEVSSYTGLASLTISLGTGSDALRAGDAAANTWTVNAPGGGTISGGLIVTFSGAETLVAGTGADTFNVTPSAGASLTINGNPQEADTLNYQTAGLSGIDVLANEITAAGVQSVFYSNIQVVSPPFADAFDRANAANLGSAWTEQAGQFAVSSQKAVSQAALSVATAAGLTLSDAAVSADVAVPAANNSLAGLLTRYSGPGDGQTNMGGIYFSAGSYHAALWRNVSGGWALLANRALPGFKGGGNVRLENFGKDLELFVNNALQVAAADAALSSGVVGLPATMGATLDNFVVSRQQTSPAFQDSFNRANSHTLGPNWTNPVGGLQLVSGRAKGTTALGLATVPGVGLAHVTVSADVTLPAVNSGSAGLVARYGGPGGTDFYFGALRFTSGAYSAVIYLNLHGTWTLLGTPASLGKASVSHKLRFEVAGTSLQLYVDSVLEVSVTDTALSSGCVGLLGNPSGTLDNFSF
jgi:hypothetical protein